MTCPNCGGNYEGDGYTSALVCENAHLLTKDYKEPDSGPWACEPCAFEHCEEPGLLRGINAYLCDGHARELTPAQREVML